MGLCDPFFIRMLRLKSKRASSRERLSPRVTYVLSGVGAYSHFATSGPGKPLTTHSIKHKLAARKKESRSAPRLPRRPVGLSPQAIMRATGADRAPGVSDQRSRGGTAMPPLRKFLFALSAFAAVAFAAAPARADTITITGFN